MTDWTKHEQWVAQRRPRKSGPSFPTSCQVKVPRNRLAQTVHADLSAQFRMGAIYAYTYNGGQWTTWATQADWDATERVVRRTPGDLSPGDWDPREIRRRELAAAGHGPSVYQPAPIAPAKRPGKAAYVEMLRRIRDGVDWSVDELDQLLAVA